MTHELYRTRRGYYVLGNLQASLGTVQSVADSTATDIAFGLRTNLWDGTDPLADDSLGRQMDRVVAACIASSRDPQTNMPIEDKIEECADSAITRLNNEWLDAGHWNDFGLSIAAAFGARLLGSEIDRFVGRGGAVWATVAVPIGERLGQIVGQARGDWLRAADDGEDTRAITGGAKLVFGNERVGGFAELVGSLANRSWCVGHPRSIPRRARTHRYLPQMNADPTTASSAHYRRPAKSNSLWKHRRDATRRAASLPAQ